jgi:hypothetical protein
MSLLGLLKSEAVRRGLAQPGVDLDTADVFYLVRDMPYHRASDRQPETIITEWRGTCSGKHYLLQALFAELGLSSQVIACTTTTPIDSELVPQELQALYQGANCRFVDVHNYLLLEIPRGGRMLVDATWPLSARQDGRVSNETFVFGEDQKPAAEPIENWVIPEGRDPQDFKAELLHKYFTPAELEFREIVIQAISQETSQDS